MKPTVVVTGASQGIGYEIAKAFVIKGYTVFAIARNTDKLSNLRDDCLSIDVNANLIPVTLDLKSTDAGDKLLSVVQSKCSHLDILINNAGVLANKPFDELTEEDMESMFIVNVYTPIRLIKALAPIMGGQQMSHIVNIGSMAGFQGSDKYPGLTLYSSTKGAIASFSECLAKEYINRNIKVNCLALGSVNTEMLQNAFPGLNAPVEADQMGKYIANFAENVSTVMNGKVVPVSM